MKSFITIKELLNGLEKKEYSSEEVFSFFKKRIEKYNPKLNAFLEVFSNESNKLNGMLSGIPGALKNNISVKDKKTTCGSKILENYRAPYNSTVAERIYNSGGLVIGATNMDEFAMGASGEFSAFGEAKNPWNLEHTPGGSSSGSAAAVAAGLVPWAIGTETGGSVRQPASFSGLVGLYPTYGRFSRYGIVAFASSTDQPGPLTKTVYDNAILASVLSGHDENDSTSISEPQKDFTKGLDGKLPKNLTIGVIEEAIKSDGVQSDVKIAFEKAINDLQALGAKIKYVSMPNLKYGIAAYFVLCYAEGASNLSRFDGTLYGARVKDSKNLIDMYVNTRHDCLGREVKRRILIGNYVLSSSQRKIFYEKASRVRRALRAEFDEAFKQVDLLISPTAATTAFKLGAFSLDPIALYLNDCFTIPNNMTGMPALSLPCGMSKDGLPIGFQFIGPRLSEELIYKAAYAYEQSTDHHLKNPKGYE